MKKQFLIVMSVVALLAIFSAVNAQAALNGYLKIAGVKSGTVTIVKCMDGTCALEGLKAGEYTVTFCDAKGMVVTNTSTDVSFTYDVKSPRDAASGLATGKRMHKPFIISKSMDKSSPVIIKIVDDNSSISFKTDVKSNWDLAKNVK